MEIFLATMVFILGLCAGSFVNMLIYRTAIRYELIRNKYFKKNDRSVCDFCGKQLSWYENVPVISWMVLRGITKCCHKNLSCSYPLVELGIALLFLIYGKVDLGLVIISALVFSAVFDLKYMVLPDFSTGILIFAALLSTGFSMQNFISAIGAAGFLLVINLVTKGRGMGMGDVKFALFMGIFLGWQRTVFSFYIAFVVGALVGILLLLLKKAKKGSQIPFGPFLILGTMVSWWYGVAIIKFLISNFP